MSDPIEITGEMSDQFDAAFPVRPDYEQKIVNDDGTPLQISRAFSPDGRDTEDYLLRCQEIQFSLDPFKTPHEPQRFFPAIETKEYSLERIKAHIIWMRYQRGLISEEQYLTFTSYETWFRGNPESQEAQTAYTTLLNQLSGELK